MHYFGFYAPGKQADLWRFCVAGITWDLVSLGYITQAFFNILGAQENKRKEPICQ